MNGDGRTVVVTGANGGVGLAIALELARAGFDVVGTVRGDPQAAAVNQAAADEGLAIRTARLDVADEEGCRELVAAERPWALVNNAGYIRTGPILEVGDDDARSQLETMLIGPVRLARLSAKHMAERGSGRIVNISSIAAEVSSPLIGWYQAAKSALEGVSDAMRLELRSAGVDVILVQPGMVRTGIWDDARDQLDGTGRWAETEAVWGQLSRRMEPLMSSPEAVAATVRHSLTTGRPKDHYPVGIDAQLLTRVARFVPSWITDAATRTLLHLR